MSNYFRTLLRFEKARGTGPSAEETSVDDATEDAQDSPEDTPQAESPAPAAPPRPTAPRRPPGRRGGKRRLLGGQPRSRGLRSVTSRMTGADVADPPRRFALDDPDLQGRFEPRDLPPSNVQVIPALLALIPQPFRDLLAEPLAILGRLLGQDFGSGESAAAIMAYGQLLDSLRSIDTRYSAPGVVLVSAGGHAPVRSVVDGLVRQARTMGVRIALAEMVFEGDERILRSRDDTDSNLPTATALELTGSASDQILRDWFDRATAGNDLLVVEGPALTHSVDGALLARSGDGLSIVLEPGVTSQEEFETAIERARASGCFVLGLVMNHHRHWLPRFLRGFFNAYPRSIRTRAKRPSRRAGTSG